MRCSSRSRPTRGANPSAAVGRRRLRAAVAALALVGGLVFATTRTDDDTVPADTPEVTTPADPAPDAEVDPDDPSRYRVPGGFEPFGTHVERLAVQGGADVELTLETTRWGVACTFRDPRL